MILGPGPSDPTPNKTLQQNGHATDGFSEFGASSRVSRLLSVALCVQTVSPVNKRQFLERLKLAGETARKFAASYVLDELPVDLCFTISQYDDPNGRHGPGTIKFLGGRFLNPTDLSRVPATRAAELLWVDGKVPVWINIGVAACLESKTELIIRFSRLLVPADENELPPDIKCPKGNPLVPFRIRGPSVPHAWRSVELDGRVSLSPNAEDA